MQTSSQWTAALLLFLAAGPLLAAECDQYGDPLPPGAIARFGTIRLRDGHGIAGLQFLPGGKELMSWSGSGTCVWDISSGKAVRRFLIRPAAGAGQMYGAALSPGARQFVAVYKNPVVNPNAFQNEGSAELWDVASGALIRRFPVPQAYAKPVIAPDEKTLALVGRGVVGEENGPAVRLYDLTTGREIRMVHNLRHEVAQFLFLPDSRYAVLAGFNPESADFGGTSARLWDLNTDTEVRRIALPAGLRDAALSPDGRVLATTDDVKPGESFTGDPNAKPMRWSSIRLWDVPTGKSLRVLPGNIGVTERAAFSTDGRRLWSLGRDSVVEWDLATGRELRSLPEKWWGSFVVTMDEKTIATAGGPAFRLRSIADGSDLVPPAIPMHMAWAMAPSPDGRLVATTDDSAVDIWETDTGVARRRVQTGGFVNSVLWSADGKSIVANVSRDGWGSGRYYQWDVATGNESPPIKAVAELRRVRLVDGNDHVLVASGEDGVTVVDRRGGKELCRFTSSTTPMAVTADGRTIFGTYEPWRYAGSHRLGDDDKGAILAWDAATGKELRRIPFRGRSIDTSVFSPDGRRMATRDWLPEIVLYDTETSAEVRRFGRIEDHLGPIQFSADGLRLAAASHGGAIVWEVATGMELHRFTGLGGSINHIAFTADGKRLITTGFDTSALVWDVSQ